MQIINCEGLPCGRYIGRGGHLCSLQNFVMKAFDADSFYNSPWAPVYVKFNLYPPQSICLPSLPFLISWQKCFWCSVISICMDFPHVWGLYITNCITRLAFPQRCEYLPLQIKIEIVGNGRCHIPAWLLENDTYHHDGTIFINSCQLR